MAEPRGPVRSRTDVRQGETNRGVRYVLVISTSLAIVAMAIIGVWFFG